MAGSRARLLAGAVRGSAMALCIALLIAGCAPPAHAASPDSARLADDANYERSSRSIGQLRRSEALDKIALAWAKQMAKTAQGKCAISSTGLRHNSKLSSQLPAGWRKSGENVGCGYRVSGPSGMVAAWMGSTGHRRNILDSEFNHIGVGYVVDDHGTPWGVQVFARYNSPLAPSVDNFVESTPVLVVEPELPGGRPAGDPVATPTEPDDDALDGLGGGTTTSPRPATEAPSRDSAAPKPREQSLAAADATTGTQQRPQPATQPADSEATGGGEAEPTQTPTPPPAELVRTVVAQVRAELHDALAAIGG